MKLSMEEVLRRLDSAGVHLVGDYKNGYTKTEVKCKKCNYQWKVHPNNMFRGSGCPSCSGKLPLTNEIVDKGLEGRSIKRLDDIIDSSTPIRWQCTIHGYIWETVPNAIRNGNGCAMCSNNNKLTNEDVDRRLESRSISRVGEVINNKTDLTWRCMVCGGEWEARPDNVLYNETGCPHCSVNKNEKLCGEALRDIFGDDDVVWQYKIKDGNFIHRCDYFINSINTLIEYNGIQHYEPVKHFGGERAYNKQKAIDDRVREIAMFQGYRLIEIDGRVIRGSKIYTHIKELNLW